MKSDRRSFIAASVFSVGALSLPASTRAVETSVNQDGAKEISIRGRVVCLTEELDKTFNVMPDCANRGHVYSIKTAEGRIYPLLPTDSAAAVWMDERFRVRDLQVTGRSFPQSDFIEVINFQSWVDNRLHDLYYFCDVCMITTFKPGPCECCQDPVVFRETPAGENSQI